MKLTREEINVAILVTVIGGILLAAAYSMKDRGKETPPEERVCLCPCECENP